MTVTILTNNQSYNLAQQSTASVGDMMVVHLSQPWGYWLVVVFWLAIAVSCLVCCFGWLLKALVLGPRSFSIFDKGVDKLKKIQPLFYFIWGWWNTHLLVREHRCWWSRSRRPRISNAAHRARLYCTVYNVISNAAHPGLHHGRWASNCPRALQPDAVEVHTEEVTSPPYISWISNVFHNLFSRK